MCLITFAYKEHAEYDLVFAANRDEFYQRPTQAAHYWDTSPPLLAGKDLSGGGTWLGINHRGKLAALTNYRDPSITRKNPPSRGQIPLQYLTRADEAEEFLKQLHQQAGGYMGFNILAGTMDNLFHYSNQEDTVNRVSAGIHGLSNHLLNTPWPKVTRAKSRLSDMVATNSVSVSSLFELLTDDRQAPDEELPDTGIPRELEKKVSPLFIKSEDYGTRSSTIILIDTDGNVTFEERRYVPGTAEIDDTNRYTFKIEQ